MRTVHFAGSLRKDLDGVTRILHEFASFLAGRNVECLFVTADPPAGEFPFPVVVTPSVPVPVYPQYRYALPDQHKIDRVVRRFRPDIIHFHSPCPLARAALRCGARTWTPVVATYHTHFPSYAKYYKVPALERWGWNYLRSLYGACDSLLVPSLPVLRELADRGFQGLIHHPHGVDAGRFHPGNRSADWKLRIGAYGRPVVLFVGRLVWEKDLRTLAGAYRILRQTRPEAVVVLAGDGPVREELRALMPEAVFLGHITGDALAEAYASSDVLAFPSTTETFGNVILEALASGLPPVCAREGGAYGSVEDGVTGFVTQPRDPAHLAERISFLADHPEQRSLMAHHARKYAEMNTNDVLFRKLQDVYAGIRASYDERMWNNSIKAA
jgi:glycosyltransferase involved in cell wall biosynthesis